MKTKSKRIALFIVGGLLLIWVAVFTVDYTRCTSLKSPVFVVAKGITEDDGGSGTYQGIGYTVEVEKHIDAEYGVQVDSVQMKLLGKVVAASIS